jgi:hypothetical protein
LHLVQNTSNLNLYLQNTNGSGKTWALNSDLNGSFNIHDTTANRLTISTTGAATFSSSLTVNTTATIKSFLFLGESLVENGVINSPEGIYINADSDASGGTNDIVFGKGRTSTSGGTTFMTIKNSGNLGLGVTPSTWNLLKPLEIGNAGNFFAGFQGGSAIYMGNAAYYNSGWKYATTGDGAGLIDVGAGAFTFSNAVAGTAGNSLTWTPRLNITSSGNVLIGTTTDAGIRLDVGTSGTGNNFRARRIYANGTGTDSGFSLNGTLIFQDSAGSFNITNPGSYPNVSFSINTSGQATFNNLAGSGNRIVVANSGGTLISAVIGSGLAFDGTTLTATGGSSGSISGSGTSGIIPVFTGATSIGNSIITQSGGDIRIQTSADYGATLSVNKVAGRNIANFSNGADADLNFNISDTGAASKFARITPSVSGQPLQLGLNNNNILIGTTSDNGNRLRVNGTIFSDSSVTATSFFESSDATLKTLVEDNYQAKGIDSVVAKLYIKNGKNELGYFAQDLQSVLPSAVSKGSDGLLNLSYREVHTAKIAYLEEEIRQIKKRYEIN